MKQLYQRNPYDSGVAVYGMLLGLPDMDAALARFGRDPSRDHSGDELAPTKTGRLSVLPEELSWALFQAGLPSFVYTPAERFLKAAPWRFHAASLLVLPDMEALNAAMKTGRTLALLVDSLNDEGAAHWLLHHEGEVWDPSPRKRYGPGASFAVHEALWVDPRPRQLGLFEDR